MRTTFICLANSRKHGERCIAGVEIQPNPKTQQYQLVKNGSRLHWIRPVSNANYGQVPTQWVERIHLLDVVNLENRGAVPRDCHQENILFEPNSIVIQTSLAPTFENLETLTTGAPMMLFGNRGNAIHTEQIADLDYSLLFVKIQEPNFYSLRLGQQLRVKFLYNFNHYDLPITDIQFCNQFYDNPKVLADAQNIYFTLSLSELHNQWHSKLVAAVFKL